MLELRRVTTANDPAIADFGQLQERTYFEPDMLIPASIIGQMLEWSNVDRQNILLVLEDSGRVVAGTLFHYLRKTNVGFSSYLAVDRDFRAQGLARRLHEARFATLDDIASAPVEGLFIDVVNPDRLSTAELELEHGVGSDPRTRLKAFASLGFKRVDVRYEQPVGGENGGAVTNMDLLFCPRDVATSIPTALVVETMRTYWMPWLGAKMAVLESKKLETRANTETIALVPLEHGSRE
jgi:GNAT superfamily N-acetyltransferase